MKVLGFDDNHLDGCLPIGLGKLQKLIYLNVANNRFSGTVSDSLFCLPALRELRIERNLLELTLEQKKLQRKNDEYLLLPQKTRKKKN